MNYNKFKTRIYNSDEGFDIKIKAQTKEQVIEQLERLIKEYKEEVE